MLKKRDYYPFKYKLGLYMSVLVLIMIAFLGSFQYINMSKVLRQEFRETQKMLQQSVANSMKDADTIYYMMEKDIEAEMQKTSQSILFDYDNVQNPAALDLHKYSLDDSGNKWADIYMIDRANIVKYSTDPGDLNLDFKKYILLSQFLNETREKGDFVSERIDISTVNKDIKKYSYLPTKDKKYIIEIGIDMNPLVEKLKNMNLDFESIKQKMMGINSSIEDVTLYNYLGNAYSRKDASGNPKRIERQYAGYLQQAIDTGKTVEFTGTYRGQKVYYSYIPYKKLYSANSHSTDVIELIANDRALQANLNTTRNVIAGMILIAFVVAMLFGLLISSLVSKPIDIMADAIEKISNGDFDQRVSRRIKSRDEFRILSKGFDDMMESVMQLLSDREAKTHALMEKNEEIVEQNEEIIKQKEEINALYEETTAMNEELYHLLDEVKENYLCTVRTLANSLEAKDKYTKGHCERVTDYSVRIAKAMGLAAEDIANIEFAGLLHDIGKIGISNDIINKEGPLTDDEYRVLKRHPEIGFEILKDVGFLEVSKKILLQHHERVDGRGYPYGLDNDNIDRLAKILAVADSYDAMTSSRPYRKAALTKEQAIDQLIRNKGTQFDPAVVDAFIQLLENEEFKEAM